MLIKGPIFYTMEELAAHKASGRASNELLDGLRACAADLIGRPTLKVIDINIPRASGDMHDYASFGPYWWPNPDTPDGLPYVRRDGVGNPEAKESIKMGDVCERLRRLALAAFYFDDMKYACADSFNLQLYDWFINPETYMNPSAKYAQAIPGICAGRASGLVDFRSTRNVVNSIAIMSELGLADGQIVAGVREWFSQFTDYVLTSEIGIKARGKKGNHGSSYDAQMLSWAIFCDRDGLAEQICKTAYDTRVLASIRPDGSQPDELKRTRAINYSLCNLEALVSIAAMAQRLGHDRYWQTDTARGECVILSAINFIAPYVMNPKSAPFEELQTDNLRARAYPIFMSAAKHLPSSGYLKRAQALGAFGMLEPAQ